MPKKGQKQNPKQNAEDSMKLVTEALHEWQVCVSLQEEEVQNDRARLDESRREFEEERRSIMSEHVCANDIIGINLGGEKIIQVKRSVLTQHEGTYLAAMFSGRWEEQLTRDRDGNIFFDEPPEVMMPLISCLRRTAAGPPRDGTPLPEPPREWRAHFVKMMDRFGLNMLVAPTPPQSQRGLIVHLSAEWCKVKWDDGLISTHWFVDGRIENLVCHDCNLALVVESAHPYQNKANDWHHLGFPGAEEIYVFFDESSSFERSPGPEFYDYVSFHAKCNESSEKYGEDRYSMWKTGHNLPLQLSPLRIPSSHCWVNFKSDCSNVAWGYRIYVTPINVKDSAILTSESAAVGLEVLSVPV